ncbi:MULTISPECIES: lysozyme [unclassified Chelatococcus]|uniref:lysozyme n=1 Tax=unclassified Chelatococcus TaxID=2638111 RepID=UPI001BCD5515|nr:MULTISPECIES: lysozyme [unclassified Chelatococcus]MBS7698786.1 glycoside hydrolase family protein [Chelatococcus sp. YT9]MBX3554632.1 glycoside hydrolase family protein [Chelatococcus sp.]
MARRTNDEGVDFIKRWEGKRLTAYLDSVGVLTIGYGHTSKAGPPTVTKGMTITDAEAERILRADLAKFERNVERLVKVPLSDFQFATLVSLDFNTGALAKSTLLKKLNRGDYNAVPGELMKWVKGKDPKTGKKVTIGGLVNRRAAECGLWAKGEFVSSNYVKAMPAKPPLLTGENVTVAAGVLGSLATAASSPGPLQWALAAVMVAGLGAGVWWLIQRRLEEAA